MDPSGESLEARRAQVEREPQNAHARMRLALAYRGEGRSEEELEELVAASELFFKESELGDCIAACERALELDPDNAVVRERRSKAVLKRDAFTALEAAFGYSDPGAEEETKSGRRKKAGSGCLVLMLVMGMSLSVMGGLVLVCSIL